MKTSRRGKNVALAGAVLQAGFTVVLLVLWLWTRSLSLLSCTMMLAAGVPLWLMVAVWFYCRQLERREASELEDLQAQGGAQAGIFRSPDGKELRPAADRVRFLEQWIVPIFTLLWAALHAAIGVLYLAFYLTRAQASDLPRTAEASLFAVIVTFVAFLLSRYCTGMGRAPQWRLLSSAGRYVLVNSLCTAASAAALLAESQGYRMPDLVVAYVPPILQLVLAAEMVLTFVLDLYRPRAPGQEQRPSFDSRLFNLLAEPEKVGRSVAEAVNYQFGFEVSKTWFYRLLSKAMAPLLALAVVVGFAMTCIVIVPAGQKCVVLHGGKADPSRGTLGPGIHLKWPWPIDTVDRFNVKQVHEVLLGAGGTRSREERKDEFVNGRELYLWTQVHGGYKEQDFLVAVPEKDANAMVQGGGAAAQTQPEQGATTHGDPPPAARGTRRQRPPPVNIIKLVVSMQYVIDDPYKFGYKYSDAAKLLECVAHREMTLYCASATLDSPAGGTDANRPEAIMTYGQGRAGKALKERIEAAVGPGGLDLGVRIIGVGLMAVHPPAEAAPAYEAVLEAERRTDEKRFEAEADAGKTLTEAAGDPQTALELALSIQIETDLNDLKNLTGQATPFAAAVAQCCAREQNALKDLEKEIELDRLTGRLRGGEETTAVVLRRKHQQHLDRLRTMLEARRQNRAFDFDGAIAEARKTTEALFARTTGQPAAMVAKAIAKRWTTELTERARAESFPRQYVAYLANPGLFTLERWLDVWDEVLPGIPKYILAVPREKVQVWLNLEQESGLTGSPTFRPEAAAPKE
jgi:regulator of protease activity HflC (stomatin/prohibitin superfamily)